MEEMTFVSTKEKLQEQLTRLRTNRENIPVQEQKTKYKRAFIKLENEIKMSVYELMKETIFFWWCTPENRIEARNYFVSLYQNSNINAAINSYNADQVEEILRNIGHELFGFLEGKNDFVFSSRRYSIDPFCPEVQIINEDGSIRIEHDKEAVV